ncbi:MAG: hypothetical protein K2M69_01760 [Muribaculaceae bacterium]|nr:hypothetical protein [Muribaculaceae bacterium]
MSKILFPRMNVLQSLYELTADITPNRFITTRPPATGEQMEEFLLIRLPQTIYDRGDTYQSTWGQIAIFVRDIQGGLENTFTLEKIQSDVMELFPIVTDQYHAKLPRLLPGGTDGAGFHSLIIQFQITIFKQPLKPY